MLRAVLRVIVAVLIGFAVAVRAIVWSPERALWPVTVWGTALAVLLAVFAFNRFVWPLHVAPAGGRRRAVLLLSLALVVAIARWYLVRPQLGGQLTWTGHAATGPTKLVRFEQDQQKQWGIGRSGFEVHAAAPGGFPGTWRATAPLPRVVRLTGGRAVLWITQPEYAVFDSAGNVNQGGDGVRVNLTLEHAGQPATQHSFDFNLHARSEERRWHQLVIPIPRGSRQIAIEATPGTPGANDWFDRVWVSFVGVSTIADPITPIADGVTLGIVIWVLGVALIAGVRPPYSGLRGVRTLLMVNGLLIGLGLIGAEVYLRRSGRQPYARTYPGQYPNLPEASGWVRVDPQFGWVANHTHGDPAINANGFRNPADAATNDSLPVNCRVMLLGDSFVFGSGVTGEENLSSRLTASLGPGSRTVNLGIPGWGIDQMFLAYRAFVDSVNPDIVVLAYIDDDIPRVLEAFRTWERLNKPSFAVVDGRLAPRGPISTTGKIVNFLGSRSALFGTALWYYYLRSDAQPVIENVVRTIATESRNTGRRFVVVRIPTLVFDLAPVVRRWLVDVERIAAQAGVDYLDLEGALKSLPGWPSAHYQQDGHLTARATAVLAGEIGALLKRAPRPNGASTGSCPRHAS